MNLSKYLKPTTVVEKGEYIKTNEGKVLKVSSKMPTHDDTSLVGNSTVSKVAERKGGVILQGVESVLSSTHENRNKNDKSFGSIDLAIGIDKNDVKEFNELTSLDIKSRGTISPSKLVDLAKKELDSITSKYKDLKPGNTPEAQAAFQANTTILKTLPKLEDLYDIAFGMQESKKQGVVDNNIAQVGGYIPPTMAKESTSSVLRPKIRKPVVNDISDLVLKNEVSPYNAQQYINAKLESKYEDKEDNFLIKDPKFNKRQNLSIPRTMLTDIVRAGKVSGVNQTPEDLMALAMRESDFGSGSQNSSFGRKRNPNQIFSNWYGEAGSNDPVREEAILKENIKYPFANEMATIKDKTKRFGIRGYNYGDPNYANKINQEKQILQLPENKKLMQYADSVYKATPKNFYDYHRFQTGGKLKKYLKY